MASTSISTSPSELNNVGVDCLLEGDTVLSFKAFQTSIQLYRDSGAGYVSKHVPSTSGTSFMSSVMEDPFLSPVVFQDKILEGSVLYLSPIRVGFTTGSGSFYFSEDEHSNLSICSAIAIFNMTIAIQSMSDEQARATGQLEGRESRVSELYKLCLSLTDSAMQDESLSSPALAVCDLMTMASMHNLVHMNHNRDAQAEEEAPTAWIGNLLMMISEIESSSRYPGHPEIASWMQELCNRFTAQAFAMFGHMLGAAAPAA